MGRTELNSLQIKNGAIRKEDMDVTTVNNSVITDIHTIGTIAQSSTGADVGTGSVTLKTVTYVHNQETPSDTWTIAHGLDKYPSVTVVDSSGRKVEGGVDYSGGLNVVTVDFNGAFSGKAYLN
jgi:hypothetical protein